jgi:hypothetical protein
MRLFSLLLIFCITGAWALEVEFDTATVESLNRFESKPLLNILGDKGFVVVFSKDCAHCKKYFRSLDKCLQPGVKIVPVSVDDNRKKVIKYWKSVGVSFKAWLGSSDFNQQFKELKQGMPFSYFVFKQKVYPIGAGHVSCEQIGQLANFRI